MAGVPIPCVPATGGDLWETSPIFVRLRVAPHFQPPAVAGRQMDVDQLQGREFLDHCPRRQSTPQALELFPQTDVHAVGQKADENVTLNPFFSLMEDGPDPQISFQILEALLNLHQLHLIVPDRLFSRHRSVAFTGKVGPDQRGSSASAHLSQLVMIQRIAESGFVHRFAFLGGADVHQSISASGFFARGSRTHEHLIEAFASCRPVAQRDPSGCRTCAATLRDRAGFPDARWRAGWRGRHRQHHDRRPV